MSEIGLLKREIFSEGTETVTMREVWDIRTPGCPIIAVRLSPFGKDEKVSIVERLTTYGRWEPRPPVTNGT